MNAATFEKTMMTVDEISRTYDSDPGHNEQVTALALAIFDALSPCISTEPANAGCLKSPAVCMISDGRRQFLKNITN